MTCDEIRLTLESDAPTVAEQTALRDHLASCSHCSEYAASIRNEDATFARALTTRTDDVSFERVKANVARDIKREHRSISRWRIVTFVGSIAAMLVVSVLAYRIVYTPKATTQIAIQPTTNSTPNVFQQVAELQTKIRSTQLLDELNQLQTALDAPEDKDGKSTAEDAELYVERILALHGTNELAFRETLHGVDRSGVSMRLQKLRDAMTSDVPKPVIAALNLAIATFDQAGKIIQSKEVAYAN